MNKTIFKYHVPIEDEFTIKMPAHAQILCVQTQGDQGKIWALVNPEFAQEERNFRLLGTGHPFDDEKLQYVGSFQQRGGALVWHLFEQVIL